MEKSKSMISSMGELVNSSQVLSVSALTDMLSSTLEQRFPFVWVRGEVTDLSVSPSGHLYFSLKDSRSLLRCVWFVPRGTQAPDVQTFDPFTGEVFEKPRLNPRKQIRNGLNILCAGSITIYAKYGRYQLIVDFVETEQTGRLAQLFEDLKAKYKAAGFFEQARKRPLPSSPKRIALITSPFGAAIHDFLRIAQTRGISSIIRLYPTPVQGTGAAEKMAQAISMANNSNWAQVIVIIRGGGSTEDLWQFNEPVLVEAVYNSNLPVLAGIGHEIDVCLTDMTADVRAATPTHAAQLLWVARNEIWQKLDDLSIELYKRASVQLEKIENILDIKSKALGWLSPINKLKRLETKFTVLAKLLDKAIRYWLDSKVRDYEAFNQALRKAKHLQEAIDSNVQKIQFLMKLAEDRINKKCYNMMQTIDRLEADLKKFIGVRQLALLNRLDRLDIALKSVDPSLGIRKGYAILYKGQNILSSVDKCSIGERIKARLCDGELYLTIDEKIRDNG